MVIVFNHNLFGTSASSNFENPPDVSDDSCDPEWIPAGNGWSWDKPLGTCGQVASHVDGKIQIAKTLEISGDTYRSVSSIFLLKSIIPVKVTFTCVFEATLSTTISTNLEVSLHPPQITGTAALTIGGSLGGSLSLKYYKDDTFTTEMDGSGKRYLGGDEFIEANWSVKTLTHMRFFVTECNIREDENTLTVIDQTCYSQTIRAQPLGDAASSISNGKAVGEKSQFKFGTFTMSTRYGSTQELECSVDFCVVTDGIL